MADEYFLLVCDDVLNDVVLIGSGPRMLDVVQAVRRLTGLSLWHSKVRVAQVPAVILDSVPEEVAEAVAAELRGAGAQAEVWEQPERDLLKG
ncbi:ribosomal protein L7/L12 [Streptomyces sp. NPDC055189]